MPRQGAGDKRPRLDDDADEEVRLYAIFFFFMLN